MKFYLLSDNIDTQTGMRLAGVEGKVVHKEDEFRTAVEEAIADGEIAVLLITEKLVDLCPEYIADKKSSSKMPLIVELPDRHGSSRPDDYIMSYVRDAIGANV